MSISLKKLKDRYSKAVKFNYDISSEGIKLTKDVIEFIKEKKLQGLKYSTYNKQYYIANNKLLLPKIIIKEGSLDVNYKIGSEFNSSSFAYSRYGIISFNQLDLGLIPESKQDEFISDSITHEFIHHLLNTLFDWNTCLLFETIEYMFRNNALHTTYVKRNNKNSSRVKIQTYQMIIKDIGLKEFINGFLKLDNIDLIQAYIIANYRLQEI